MCKYLSCYQLFCIFVIIYFVVYIDVCHDQCTKLMFALGNQGVNANIPTRTWSIKVRVVFWSCTGILKSFHATVCIITLRSLNTHVNTQIWLQGAAHNTSLEPQWTMCKPTTTIMEMDINWLSKTKPFVSDGKGVIAGIKL